MSNVFAKSGREKSVFYIGKILLDDEFRDTGLTNAEFKANKVLADAVDKGVVLVGLYDDDDVEDTDSDVANAGDTGGTNADGQTGINPDDDTDADDYGLPTDLDELKEIADDYGLPTDLDELKEIADDYGLPTDLDELKEIADNYGIEYGATIKEKGLSKKIQDYIDAENE